ncbi:hypothetical protein [Enterobacter hormaechei]|uniref:hypothetical protein n=1 Tax=Enterobacter hormaechei TaxID=158836 RepID=UPI0023B1D71F|nr:hypothetical protein [Enterobacter hormaechei]MDE7845093.1 hypothetical protein [Enterobacter hormaechei]
MATESKLLASESDKDFIKSNTGKGINSSPDYPSDDLAVYYDAFSGKEITASSPVEIMETLLRNEENLSAIEDKIEKIIAEDRETREPEYKKVGRVFLPLSIKEAAKKLTLEEQKLFNESKFVYFGIDRINKVAVDKGTSQLDSDNVKKKVLLAIQKLGVTSPEEFKHGNKDILIGKVGGNNKKSGKPITDMRMMDHMVFYLGHYKPEDQPKVRHIIIQVSKEDDFVFEKTQNNKKQHIPAKGNRHVLAWGRHIGQKNSYTGNEVEPHFHLFRSTRVINSKNYYDSGDGVIHQSPVFPDARNLTPDLSVSEDKIREVYLNRINSALLAAGFDPIPGIATKAKAVKTTDEEQQQKEEQASDINNSLPKTPELDDDSAKEKFEQVLQSATVQHRDDLDSEGIDPALAKAYKVLEEQNKQKIKELLHDVQIANAIAKGIDESKAKVEAEKKLATTTETLEKTEESLKTTQNELQGVKAKYSTLAQEHTDTLIKKSHLETEVSNLTDDKKQLETNLQQTSKNLSNTVAKHVSSKAKVVKQAVVINTLESEVKSLEKENKLTKHKLTKREATIEVLNGTIETLNKQIDGLKNRIETLHSDISDLIRENADKVSKVRGVIGGRIAKGIDYIKNLRKQHKDEIENVVIPTAKKEAVENFVKEELPKVEKAAAKTAVENFVKEELPKAKDEAVNEFVSKKLYKETESYKEEFEQAVSDKTQELQSQLNDIQEKLASGQKVSGEELAVYIAKLQDQIINLGESPVIDEKIDNFMDEVSEEMKKKQDNDPKTPKL